MMTDNYSTAPSNDLVIYKLAKLNDFRYFLNRGGKCDCCGLKIETKIDCT